MVCSFFLWWYVSHPSFSLAVHRCIFVPGGADTVSDLQFVETGSCQLLCQSVSAIYAFFLAMTLFPEAQKKAQAEIDVVIGTDHLQTYTDRESLPFVAAVIKEILRWHVVAPLGNV